MLGNNENSGYKYLGLKAKTSDVDPTPYFGLREKDEKGEWVVSQKFSFVEGYLTSIENSSYEYKGQQRPTVRLKIEDAHETYMIDCSLNTNIMKNMLNSLLGSKDRLSGRVKISVYAKKGKGSDRVFANSFITIDGNNTDWAYQPDQFPAIETAKNKKGESIVVDDSDYLAFLQNMVTQIQEALPKKATATAAPVAAMEEAPAPSDDLPF
jgi:hypothetical protein